MPLPYLILCNIFLSFIQKNHWISHNITANTAHDQKLDTLNHDTSPSVSWIISTVIIKPTIQRVRKLRGILMAWSNNPIVAFTILSTRATIIAVHRLATVIPGTMYAAIAIAIPPTRIFNKNFMIIRKIW